MALYEKRDKMPPYLAEIPYGFKNLWRISVSQYSLGSQTFAAASVQSVILNGYAVTVDQLRQLYDYNRDPCSLIQSGSDNGLYITLTGFDADSGIFSFHSLVEQSLEIVGVLGVAGDMVDNTDPTRPVILHDSQKLDVQQYSSDQAALETRLAAAETDIQDNSAGIEVLQDSAVTGVTVNGDSVPVVSGTAQIAIDAVTPDNLDIALNAKVDKTVAGSGNKIVQSLADSFDTETRTLSLNKTLLSLEDGSTETASGSYALADLLGVTALEAIDKELFYFCGDAAITSFDGNSVIPLSGLYRYNADGTVYHPAETDNIRLVIAMGADYVSYGVVGRSYVSAIGNVLSATTTSLTCAFASLTQFVSYNKHNGYRAGTIIYDPALQSTFQALQNVPRPTAESNVIPLTNTLYYTPVKDYEVMGSDTVWANFEEAAGPGEAYAVADVRRRLLGLGSGYDEYIDFIPATVPVQILTDADWDANIRLWVTDGLQFASRSTLLNYLSNFATAERFKLSNRGIVSTRYEAGGITITPLFTQSSIETDLTGSYQPVPSVLALGNLPVFDSANILVPSGKMIADFATAAQGAKADTAVQSVALSPGSADGTIQVVVNGVEQTAAVTGLGPAAYANTTDFATAAQGIKADSALQSAVLSAGTENGMLQLATNGTAQSPVMIPGLSTAAYADASSFATASQGAKADTAIQTLTISPGAAPGTIQYSVNGDPASTTSVGGLGSAAYTAASEYATSTQGLLADSALQASDIVDNLQSTSGAKPLSANQGRVLEQLIQSVRPDGKPIGGFFTLGDAYTDTSDYADDLQPININDTIYVASDENHTNQPAQYKVSAISPDGEIIYSFVRILPDASRNFTVSPIQASEIAPGAINTTHMQNDAVTGANIADGAVTNAKLSTDVQASLSKAESALQSGITTTGSGALVSSVTQNADKTLNVAYTNNAINMDISGNGDFITGASIVGTNLELIKDGTALKTVTVAGAGNAVVGVSATSTAITVTKGNIIASLNTTGSGNVVTDVSSDGVVTKGTVLAAINKSGSGNVITGVSVSNGDVQLTSGNAFTTLNVTGTGNVVSDIVESNGTLTVTKTSAITAQLPLASTSQAGIVQLNNTLASTAVDEALTAAQGKALADQITAHDSTYVKLAGNQTITGAKTLEYHLIVPSKDALPVTPSATSYATEAQTATRIAKPAAAGLNNIAVFDASMNVVDSGIAYTSIAAVSISNEEIDAAFSEIFN